MNEKKLTLINLDALQKLVEESENEHEEALKKLQNELDTAVQQYNQVVQQNKDLQSERNVYRNAITEIQAIANKSKNYSSTATKIYNKCVEIL